MNQIRPTRASDNEYDDTYDDDHVNTVVGVRDRTKKFLLQVSFFAN